MKILKWSGIALSAIVALLSLLVLIVYLVTESHWNQTVLIDQQLLELDYSNADIERGRHVATIRGCVDCHGESLGGTIFIDEPAVGRLVASNLTTGDGGLGSDYTKEELVLSIRHGVGRDNKPLLFMPSHEYNNIDADDLASLIAYIRSVEPVDNTLPDHTLTPLIRSIYLLDDDFILFPARVIDHSEPIPEPVAARTPVELGEYLSTTCMGCHGKGFGGGEIPGVPPDWPPASNLTPGGVISDYSTEDFIRTLRSGITPDGRVLRNQYMPWQGLGKMKDEELEALLIYFKSLEPKESGTR